MRAGGNIAIALGSIAMFASTAVAQFCPGDLDASGSVEVDEIVNVLTAALSTCGGDCLGDLDSSGDVTVDELVTVVQQALVGCPAAACPHRFNTVFALDSMDPFCIFEAAWSDCRQDLIIECTTVHRFNQASMLAGISCSLLEGGTERVRFVTAGFSTSALAAGLGFVIFLDSNSEPGPTIPTLGTLVLSGDHTAITLRADDPILSYTPTGATEPCELTHLEMTFSGFTEPRDESPSGSGASKRSGT